MMEQVTALTLIQLPHWRIAANQFLVLAINFIGFLGIVLITYSIVAARTDEKWAVAERWADGIAIYATLVGTFLTACSVYLPVNIRPPDEISLVVTAPIVIITVLLVLIIRTFTRVQLPAHLINGLALLAISGALFRLLSR